MPTLHTLGTVEHVSSYHEAVWASRTRPTARMSLNWLRLSRALYDDSCLFVVPGSHRQPRTPEQRALSISQEAPADPMAMPGAICVTLQGQQVVHFAHIPHVLSYRSW